MSKAVWSAGLAGLAYGTGCAVLVGVVTLTSILGGGTATAKASVPSVRAQPCEAMSWTTHQYLVYRDEPDGRIPFIVSRTHFLINEDCPPKDGLVSVRLEKKVKVGFGRYKWIGVPDMYDHKDTPFPPSFTLELGPRVCTSTARYRTAVFFVFYGSNVPPTVVNEPTDKGQFFRCK